MKKNKLLQQPATVTLNRSLESDKHREMFITEIFYVYIMNPITEIRLKTVQGDCLITVKLLSSMDAKYGQRYYTASMIQGDFKTHISRAKMDAVRSKLFDWMPANEDLISNDQNE